MKRTILLVCVLGALLAVLGAFFLRPQPKAEYAWLVFGPDAKVRVLVTMQGEAVSLEHYLDGQPTGRKERFPDRAECKNVVFSDPDGKTTYTINEMSGTVVRETVPTDLYVGVEIQGPASYHQYCDLKMTGDRETARLAHFHGPLIVQVKTGQALERGDKPTDLQVLVGTLNPEKGCWVVVRTHDSDSQPDFPKGVHPFVDVEFPPRQAGSAPLKRRYALDKIC